MIRAPKIGGHGTRAGSLAQNALLKPRQVGGHVRGLAAGRTRRRTNHGLGINAMYGQVRFEEVVLTLKSVTRIFRPAPCLNSTAPTCQMLVMPGLAVSKSKTTKSISALFRGPPNGARRRSFVSFETIDVGKPTSPINTGPAFLRRNLVRTRLGLHRRGTQRSVGPRQSTAPPPPLTDHHHWPYQRGAGRFPALVICPAGLRRGEISALKRPASGPVFRTQAAQRSGHRTQGP